VKGLYPLVIELAADGIRVAVTCRVLKLARQPYYRWRANPLTDAESMEAYRANMLAAAAGCRCASGSSINKMSPRASFDAQVTQRHDVGMFRHQVQRYYTAAAATCCAVASHSNLAFDTPVAGRNVRGADLGGHSPVPGVDDFGPD
jgi:hypothetical protein